MAQPIAFFDLDGTFFRWQLYHEVVFEFKERGLFAQSTASDLDQALIEWQAKRISWHDYEMQVVEAFEPVIAKISPKDFDEVAMIVIDRSGHKIYNYTNQLRQSLADQGYYTLAISGSQQEIAEAFAKGYNFDAAIGSLYERVDNQFTGQIIRRVIGRKHEIVKEFLDQHHEFTLEGSVAVGDSSGDISLLEIVDRPIAFNPDSSLLAVAQQSRWEIVVERKNIAYTLKAGDDGQFILAEAKQF